MASSSLLPTSFLSPLIHSSRSVRPCTLVYRHLHLAGPTINPRGSIPSRLSLLEASPGDVPLAPPLPLVVLAAVALLFAAQLWIKSLLGGDQGLGAFLSDGTGFGKSGFQPRGRRPITDESGGGDPSRPLGGPDPLPWLKLPELDFVEVAGQPKRPKSMPQPMQGGTPPGSVNKDEPGVVAKLEFLRERMKAEVERGNLAGAKRIEDELERIMEEGGYDFSRDFQ